MYVSEAILGTKICSHTALIVLASCTVGEIKLGRHHNEGYQTPVKSLLRLTSGLETF